MPFGKAEIAQMLAHAYGYRLYCEITTSTTGFRFHQARAAGYAECRRLVYRCPPTFDDGEPIDYRSEDDDTAACVARMRSECRPFDIMLVDPHHTYECSLRDLRDAWSLLRPGGALVVHDCDPPSLALASPDCIPGAWCGVTYKAFLDFVIADDSLRYCCVDADYGCGVIFKTPRSPSLWERLGTLMQGRTRRRVEAAWLAVGDDFTDAYRLFRSHRSLLLKLVDVETFVRRYSRVITASPPTP